MHISKIENNSNNLQTKLLAFKAKISLKSSGIAEYCNYLERCKDAPKGWFSSNRNIDLFSKICKAFDNHPSEEVLETKVIYRKGELFNARGVLETNRGKITDIEPSRSDDGMGPMEYLFRKLLNPENKKVLNGLLGEEYSAIYPKWWNENIKPIWNEINELYKIDNTIAGNLSEREFNHFFRQQFRKKYCSPKRAIESKNQIKESESVIKRPVIERLKLAWKIIKGD